jgi:hypothetical protein
VSGYDDDFPVILGFGSMHDLRDADDDPRNPRLAGLRSVSRAGAIGLAKRRPAEKRRPIGFQFPRARQ